MLQAPQLLRELLEREVAEHISHLEKRRKELVSCMRPSSNLQADPAWRSAACKELCC